MPIGITADLLTISCRKCGAHWWAVRLEAGNIRDQIRKQFNDDAASIVRFLDDLKAPAMITATAYWQVALSSSEQHRFVHSIEGNMHARSRAFFQSLAAA